jgi:hypothetical protein
VANKPRNDRNNAVTKFCLAMEEHRRTEAGRVRNAKEFVTQFFPHDPSSAKDLVFHHIPNEVRGPVLSAWGIRGAKAALRDDDEKVKAVVHDAFVAGDIDDAVFEDGVTAQTLVDWIPLPEWWTFWRQGKLTGVAIQKALATARELALIDDRWFLLNVQGRGGKLKGTDVLCDTLSKDQIVAWIRKIHETGDGSPPGIIAAIGWETVLAKTAQDALLYALDQFARKAALAPEAEKKDELGRSVNGPPTSQPQPSADVATAKPAKPDDGAAAGASGEGIERQESGLPVAIPDFPVVEGPSDVEVSVETASIPVPSVEEPSMWSGGVSSSESPKLAEARAAMMAMLGNESKPPGDREGWGDSDAPAKPLSLEWPEPEPMAAKSAGPSAAGEEQDTPHKGLPPVTAPQKAPPPGPRNKPAPPPFKR